MKKTLVTLAKGNTHSVEIKKSRFLATAVPISDPQEALQRVGAIGDPEATHNCWAYNVGNEYRFSDDGEPGGSAGRPILAAIQGQGLDHVLVVVTRYFGGIKLGVGGLVRAYGGAAAECLRTAERLEVRPTTRLSLLLPFDCVSALYPLLAELNIKRTDEVYEAGGLRLEAEVEDSLLELFQTRLNDLSQGRVRIEEQEPAS